LEIVDRPDPATPPLARRAHHRHGADAALPFAKLRACYRVCAATLYERLAALANTGCVVKTDVGYRLADGTNTLARHGHGRSPPRTMTLDRHEQ
jgi:hypothetical protein